MRNNTNGNDSDKNNHNKNIVYCILLLGSLGTCLLVQSKLLFTHNFSGVIFHGGRFGQVLESHLRDQIKSALLSTTYVFVCRILSWYFPGKSNRRSLCRRAYNRILWVYVKEVLDLEKLWTLSVCRQDEDNSPDMARRERVHGGRVVGGGEQMGCRAPLLLFFSLYTRCR